MTRTVDLRKYLEKKKGNPGGRGCSLGGCWRVRKKEIFSEKNKRAENRKGHLLDQLEGGKLRLKRK